MNKGKEIEHKVKKDKVIKGSYEKREIKEKTFIRMNIYVIMKFLHLVTTNRAAMWVRV